MQTLRLSVVVNISAADLTEDRGDAIEICFVELVRDDGLSDCVTAFAFPGE